MSKFVSLFLSTTTLVAMLGVAPIAHGQTVADLQAQIQALLQQIAQLQSQLGTVSGGGSTGACGFTRDLTVGATGADVQCLQRYLNGAGYTVSTSGAGSSGSESTYFGSKTAAATAKWQAANGVTPSVGYFGAKSRAKYNSLAGGAPGTPGPGPVVPAPATGVSVGLASDNPTAGSLISSATSAAARVPVLTVNVTAGFSGPVTLNDLKFTKQGVLSDTAISSAYLIENGRVVAQFSSLSKGVISFTGMGLSIGAGQTRKLTLAIDPATNLSAGNTVGFSVVASGDVAAVDLNGTAIAAGGLFPLNGNTFTVTSVSNPAIASVTIASSSVGTSVYAGTNNVLVSQWTVTPSNSAVDLKGLTFKVIGSATKSDIKNVKLFANGTQIGQTLSQVAGDGVAHFDLASAPARFNTGSNNMQVYADVTGSPSFNFQFEILNSYDVLAIDTQYGVPVSITVNGGTGVQISILQGTLTVSQASNTPTGNISKGGSATSLAKWTIYAAGEPVKVKFLEFKTTFTGTTSTLSNMVKNLQLVDDAGNQIGTTINTPPSSNTCESGAAALSAAGVYTDCFGTSSSNINYIIPANTTRVLTLKADVQTTAAFSTIVAALTTATSALQGQISSQTSSVTGPINGSVLTLVSNILTVAKNSAVGTQVYTAGTTNAKIGSYALTASSAEGVNLNSITIGTSASSTNFTNLRINVGGQSFGITQSTLTASASYTFSGNTSIPAGQTKLVDVYADILSNTAANTYTVVTDIENCSGSGASTFTSVTCTATNGQDLAISGQATVTIAADSSQPAPDQHAMGTAGVPLAAFRFTETSNVEDVKITDLYVFQQVTATNTTKSALSNVALYKGSTLLANAGSATTYASTSNPGPGYYYKFSFASPVIVPRSNSVSLLLKGDVASYSSSGATDNTTHIFKITSASADTAIDTSAEVVVAYGATSNATTSISGGSANSNTQTVLRSKLVFAAATTGVTAGRARAVTDDFAQLTFSADAAGSVAVNSVVVTFSGTLPSGANFLDGITLIDENGSALGSGNTTSSACAGGTTTCTKTFNLGSTSAGQTISSGQSRTWVLRVDSTKGQAAVANTAHTLSAVINTAANIQYTDALDSSAATTLGLPTKQLVPVNLNSVSYSVGT